MSHQPAIPFIYNNRTRRIKLTGVLGDGVNLESMIDDVTRSLAIEREDHDDVVLEYTDRDDPPIDRHRYFTAVKTQEEFEIMVGDMLEDDDITIYIDRKRWILMALEEEKGAGPPLNDQANGNGRDHAHRPDPADLLCQEIAKMSLRNCPFAFSGKQSEDLFQFKFNIERFAEQNNIDEPNVLRLLTNGTWIKGRAFDHIAARQPHQRPAAVQQGTDAQLTALWRELQSKYRRGNRIFGLKEQLNALHQGNTPLKEYLDHFDELTKNHEMEVHIQAEQGHDYQPLSSLQKAAYLLNGLNSRNRDVVITKAIEQHNTTQLTLEQMDLILDKVRLFEDYNQNSKIHAQRAKIHIMDRLNGPNQEQRGRGQFDVKCKDGRRCRWGIDCKFQHSTEEKQLFQREGRRRNRSRWQQPAENQQPLN